MKRSPEGRKPVSEYSEQELHQALVADAVKHHATYLPWLVDAVLRIGELNGRGPEAAYQAVLDEVEALTGARLMPLSAAMPGELKAMGL